MEEIVYRIKNANVKKKFSSMDEVNNYIKDNNIIPSNLTTSLIIEKTVTTIENSEVETKLQEKLSKEGALIFLNRFLELSNKKNYLEIDSLHINNLLKNINSNEKYQNDPITKCIYDKIRTYNLNDEYFDTYSYDNWQQSKKRIFSETFLHFINNVIENIDNFYDKTTWINLKTNYKPCDAYGMRISIGQTTIHFLIRKEDTLISHYALSGRNVNSKGIYYLNDNDL